MRKQEEFSPDVSYGYQDFDEGHTFTTNTDYTIHRESPTPLSGSLVYSKTDGSSQTIIRLFRYADTIARKGDRIRATICIPEIRTDLNNGRRVLCW